MAKKRIVIVDDHEVVRIGLRALLAQHPQFEIIDEASNVKDALEIVHKLEPDIVLMDIIMPKMDGMMALKTILGVNPAAKVIMVTAIQSIDMAKLAFKCGAMSYIIKPFQRQGILQEIDKVLHQ